MLVFGLMSGGIYMIYVNRRERERERETCEGFLKVTRELINYKKKYRRGHHSSIN